MKSKPTNKKLKVEVTSCGPPTTPEKGTGATPSVSPAGSTSSSNASSLLSIGPPSYTLGVRVGTEVATGSVGGSVTSGKSGGSKKGAAAKDKEAAKGGVNVEGSAVGGTPTFPKLTHFNLAEFPKINACIVGSQGGAGVAQAQGNGTPGVGDANKPIDALTMEDIDALQAELETLWSNVATRIRILHREQSNIQSAASSTTSTTTTTHHHHHNLGLEHFDPQHQEKIASVAAIIDHGTRTSVSAAAKLVMGVQLGTANSPVPSPSPAAQSVSSTPSSTKRSANTKGERLPKKKLKGEGTGGLGKAKKAGAAAAAAAAAAVVGEKPAARATQNRSHSVCSDFGSPGDGAAKHEVPTQFWESVEAYCRDLVPPDIDGINEVLEEHGELAPELFEIPALGKHFRDDEETAKTKAKESRVNSSRDCVGPLTQRLVSALVDERVSMFNNNHLNSPKEDASLGSSASNNPEGGYLIHRHGLVRALGLDSGSGGSSPSLESRIRDCLVDHGLLPPDDANDPILLNPDDELLAEIKRTQSVLKKLHSYNADKVLGVIDLGKRAMDRNVHKRDLEKADKDLFDTFKNLSTIRLKKKPLTKKERDSATKTLEQRKRILLKLESIRGPRSNGMSFGGPGSNPMDPNGLLRMV